MKKSPFSGLIFKYSKILFQYSIEKNESCMIFWENGEPNFRSGWLRKTEVC